MSGPRTMTLWVATVTGSDNAEGEDWVAIERPGRAPYDAAGSSRHAVESELMRRCRSHAKGTCSGIIEKATIRVDAPGIAAMLAREPIVERWQRKARFEASARSVTWQAVK